MKFSPLSLVFLLLCCLGPGLAAAKTVEQKTMYFKIDTGDLMAGNVHYYFVTGTPDDLYKSIPEVFELVPLPLLREKGVEIALLKSVFVMERVVGFFDHEHMTNEKFVAHSLAPQSVRKAGPVYKVSKPGADGYTYDLRSYFDSDDISTLPQSKVSKIIATSKKLDVIAQGASATVVNEYSNFSRHLRGGTSVTSYMSLKDNKTLVVHYKMMIVKTAFAQRKTLEESFLSELLALKRQTESFPSTR